MLFTSLSMHTILYCTTHVCMYVQIDTLPHMLKAFVAYDCWHVFERMKHMCYGTSIVVIANVSHNVVLLLVLCTL